MGRVAGQRRSGLGYSPPLGFTTLTISPDGGWEQFTKPVAAYYNGKTYFAYVQGDNGDLCIRSFDHATQTVSAEFVLESAFQVDDHAHPAVLVRDSDKRIVVAYSTHNDNNQYIRISTNPEDVSAWGSRTDIDSSLGGTAYTYAGLSQMTGVTNDPIYLFCRPVAGAVDQTWAYSASTDDGGTWPALTTWLSISGRTPYPQVVKTSPTRIDLLVADGHWTTETDISIYHAYHDASAGTWHKTDGTAVTLPLNTSKMTLVFDGNGEETRANDVILSGGNPRALFRYRIGASDYRYRIHEWSGSAWSGSELAVAGSDPGGVCFDRSDPDVIYASIKSGTQELWEYTRLGLGSWAGYAKTRGSAADNFAPHSPADAAAGAKVIWLYGSQTDFENWSAGIRAA